MSPSLPPQQHFLGIAFTPLDLEGGLQACAAAGRLDQPFRYMVTPNADHVVRFHRRWADLSPLYEQAWLRINDSRVIGRLARLAGLDLKLCPGSDLSAALVQRGVIAPADPVTLIGGTPEVADALRQRFGLTALHHYNPPFGFYRQPEGVARCVAEIVAHPARFVFLAVGSPQQEMVAAAVLADGRGVGLGLCIGAALEFLTGERRRAPRWMQVAGLEWLHRLLSEPKRLWRRYLVDSPAIFWLFVRDRLGHFR